MQKPPLSNVLGHWSKLIENFQTSTLDYYAAIEAALAQRQIPGIKTSRVDFRESSVLSAKREYLRVSRKDLTFDICGAPFGTGFFFSSWLIEKPRPRTFLYLALLLALFWVADFYHVLGITRLLYILTYPLARRGLFPNLTGLIRVLFLLPLLLWVLGWVFRHLFETRILATPRLGTAYRRLFHPLTYYHVDTMLMFRASTQAAMLEVIDGLTAARGIRALSEDERKPILRDFWKR